MSATVEEFDSRLRANELLTATTALRIDGHEKVCAERYEAIARGSQQMMQSIDKTNSLLLKVGLGLLGSMAAILVKLVFFS